MATGPSIAPVIPEDTINHKTAKRVTYSIDLLKIIVSIIREIINRKSNGKTPEAAPEATGFLEKYVPLIISHNAIAFNKEIIIPTGNPKNITRGAPPSPIVKPCIMPVSVCEPTIKPAPNQNRKIPMKGPIKQ